MMMIARCLALLCVVGLVAGQTYTCTNIGATGFSDRPLKMLQVPGEERFIVITQDGVISNIDKATGALTPFMDISGLTFDDANEKGLLGLAFDPGFPAVPHFYVYYSSSAGGVHISTLARYSLAPGDPTTGDADSATIVATFEQPYGNHNGGDIWFGPDCYLYVALGDGGSGNDPQGRGQDLTSPLAKIWRISPNDNGVGYTIPDDNPYFANTTVGLVKETWAWGLRNPWRNSYDKMTRDLYSADVGQSAREEVDLIVKGGNYGWADSEGNIGTVGIKPIFDYPRVDGVCIIGGYVYRGPYDDLRGKMILGDTSSGNNYKLATFDAGAGTWSVATTDICGTNTPHSFAEDDEGHVYTLTSQGIFRIEVQGGATTPQTFPQFYTCSADLASSASSVTTAFAALCLSLFAVFLL